MHTMIFDLESKGHHAIYIRYIINYWSTAKKQDLLTIVVSPGFVAQHKETVALTQREDCRGIIRFKAISEQEEAALNSHGRSRVFKVIQRLREWQLIRHYVELIGASHCIIMFLDKLQLPIAFGLKIPCSYSGIYFRPSLHYAEFKAGNSKNRKTASTFEQTLGNLKDILLLSRLNQNSNFRNLFVLDPYAAEHIQKRYKSLRCIHLPDPIQPLDYSLTIDKSDIVQEGRIAFVVFGQLNERKGIGKILDALEHLPVESCKNVCLMLIGKLDSSIEEYLSPRLEYLASSKSVQFFTHFEFVSEQQIYNYFRIADVVLAVYQKHVGMSGILLTAAGMQKPVLSQDYGLMGELVRNYDLGLTVDSTDTSKIAESMEHILDTAHKEIGNRESMIDFSKQHSSDEFCRTIIESL